MDKCKDCAFLQKHEWNDPKCTDSLYCGLLSSDFFNECADNKFESEFEDNNCREIVSLRPGDWCGADLVIYNPDKFGCSFFKNKEELNG